MVLPLLLSHHQLRGMETPLGLRVSSEVVDGAGAMAATFRVIDALG